MATSPRTAATATPVVRIAPRKAAPRVADGVDHAHTVQAAQTAITPTPRPPKRRYNGIDGDGASRYGGVLAMPSATSVTMAASPSRRTAPAATRPPAAAVRPSARPRRA